MQEVTAAMDYEEKQELQEHIQSYLDGLRDEAKFKLVSCDRYSMEGYEGSKVISTRALKKGESVVGVVGRTCPVSEDHEKELALRGVDTSCVIKSSRFYLFSSVRSSNSHPDLLLIHHPPPLFQITPVLNTGLSLSEPLQLYKGYNAI